MKILRIIARLNIGGPARHVTLLDEGLRARGHETLLVHGVLDEGEASLEQLAVERGLPTVRQQDLGRSVRAASDARAFQSLLRLMFRYQPDVVHTHTAKAGTLGRLAAAIFNATRSRRRRAIVVHTFHGHVFEGYFSPAISRLVRATERSLAAVTDRIVTISPRQRQDIVERFRIASASKTSVVPLGLDLDALLSLPPEAPHLRSDIGADPGDIVVGYAGRMVPVKDLATLVRAFERAWRTVPAARLVLAGDGPQRAELATLAASLGIGSRVHFLGWVQELPRFYATIDVFALSSLNEGTPVAAIEAMAAARPVVSTQVGGVPDVIETGVSGLLVPARDVEKLAAAMIELAGDPHRRAAMGAAGRARAAEHYSHRRLVDDVERLYVDLLRVKRA